MAGVEWEHEAHFRALVHGHWLGRRLPVWPRPSGREHIRASYAEDRGAQTAKPGPLMPC